jgi:hypothetical protein
LQGSGSCGATAFTRIRCERSAAGLCGFGQRLGALGFWRG